jgi:Zn(II)-responsive transcriptional regulator
MLTIGELAGQAQVSTDTLRYYEREGLVIPQSRTGAGYRLYSQEELRRLRFIKHAQDCGFSLAEVRELLELQLSDSACCKDVRSRAVGKKLQLEQKIKALKTMSAALSHLIEACQGDSQPLDECPILAALEAAVTPPAKGASRA